MMDNLGGDIKRMMWMLVAGGALGGMGLGALIFWLIQRLNRAG